MQGAEARLPESVRRPLNGYLGSDHNSVRPTRRVPIGGWFFPLIEAGIVSEGIAQVIDELGNPRPTAVRGLSAELAAGTNDSKCLEGGRGPSTSKSFVHKTCKADPPKSLEKSP